MTPGQMPRPRARRFAHVSRGTLKLILVISFILLIGCDSSEREFAEQIDFISINRLNSIYAF